MGSAGIKNFSEVQARLKRVETLGQGAVKNTISDMRSRAPNAVRDAVCEVYNIKPADFKQGGNEEISSKKVVNVQLRGETIESLSLKYTGRRLTPLHFSMTPKKVTKKTRREGEPIQMTVKKSKTATLPGNTFLQEIGGRTLPFQRKGDGRYPMQAFKTISVPSMIDAKPGVANELTEPGITENLVALIDKRLSHHLARAQSRI